MKPTAKPSVSLEQLALLLGGKLYQCEPFAAKNTSLLGVAPIETALENQATFLIKPEYAKFASKTLAGVVITAKIIEDCSRPQIVHENPYYAFAKTSQLFMNPETGDGRVSSQACVHPTATIGKNVTIYPFVTISEGAIIGEDSILYPGVFVGSNAKVGRSCVLRANVVLEYDCELRDRVLVHAGTVIGSDGFGFAPGRNDIAKIPQVGSVIVMEDCEIGAGSTIDRGAMGSTKIGKGSKLDSSVHVAHNVQIGENTMICGGSHIAGSAKIGAWNIVAGASNVTNHVTTVDRVTVGGMSGVTKSLTKPGEYIGYPAIPSREWKRQIVHLRRLDQLNERLKVLEGLLGRERKNNSDT